MKRLAFCLLLVTGCSSVPADKEEKAELDKYTRPLGDKIWYCESRGGRSIRNCGWVDRREIEKMIYTLYRW